MTSAQQPTAQLEGLPENPWPGAVAIMLATLMVYLDTTVVNLSLPHMAGSLSSTINEATWALTSYLAANAVILPLSGWLANFFGRKRLILTALVGFIASSLLCGLAVNLPMLIVFRVAQGLTGGLMQPISQAVMLESFPVEERGKAMGFWSTGIVLAPVLGPLLGGYLTEHHSWRWVFLINVPLGAVGLLMVQRFIRDPSYIKRSTARIDVPGIVLVTLGIASIQILLDQGNDKDWFASPLMRVLLVVGVLSLIGFVWSSLRTAAPVADLRVFADRTFAVGTLLSSLVGFLLYGSIVVLPLLLQTRLGYPPLQAGYAIVPRGVGALLAFPLVGLLTDRMDARRLLAAGLAIGFFTMFWFSLLDQNLGFWDLFWPQFIQGIALGLLFVPLSTVTMYPIARQDMGNATSVYNMMRNLGSSIGIATVATYLARTTASQRQYLSESVDAYSPAVMERLSRAEVRFGESGADPQLAAEQALATLSRAIDGQASMLAFLGSFRMFAWIFAVMIPFAFLMRRPTTK